jgi:hypothetical protein
MLGVVAGRGTLAEPFFDWDIRNVIPEVAGADEGQPRGRAPAGITRHGQHRHPEPVAQRLGGDRLTSLVVEHGDQVGGGGQDLVAALGDEELVLEGDPQ